MKHRQNLTAVLFLAAAALTPAFAGGLDYQLVWSDEFSGTAVDPTKWSFQIGDGCPGLCGWGNAELEYYRPENATVANGLLTITAREEAFGGRDYTSARMRTKGLMDWTYGRFEMRATLPVGQGLWPAFWMLPTDSPYGTWAASGEIDIMEYVGHRPNEVLGTLHFGGEWPDNVYRGRDFRLPEGSFDEGMHDFALEWSPTEIRWFVDGEQYGCQSQWHSFGGPYPAPFDEAFHLLLNVAVGGYLPGDPDASTVFPQELVVDHVRVYQRPEFPECEILFDGMDHNNPSAANGWFTFYGNASGFVDGRPEDLPPGGCTSTLNASFNSGGSPGFFGGFGRRSPTDLAGMTHFGFWIDPDADQDYVIEINLQDDDNGDNAIPGAPDGADDEFQYACHVSPTGPCAIAGGGWQYVSLPLADFYDDNAYHYGGNGVFDPFPVASGGNGQLVNVVAALVSNSGDDISFRTDRWVFTSEATSISGRLWEDANANGVRDPGEADLGGVDVQLIDAGGGVVQATTTSGGGIYHFGGLPWGEYTVAVQPASLPAGAEPVADPDGVLTPHTTTSVLGCSTASTDQNFAYAGPPRPTSAVLADKNGTDLEVSYDTSCSGADHAVLFGFLGDFTAVTDAVCAVGNSGSATATAPAGDVWFLVAGRDATRYSSVGRSTAGERLPTGVDQVCAQLTAQDLTATCP